MKLLEKKRVASHEENRAPLCGLVSYISAREPVLLRRLGWEVGDDIHDAFEDSISRDNGQTWSDPRRSLSIEPEGNGYIVHTENAVLYLPERDLLLHLTNDKFEPDLAGCDLRYPCRVRVTTGEPQAVSSGEGAQSFVSDFGLEQGIAVSFCYPIQDSKDRILVPLQWQKKDEDGSIRAYISSDHSSAFPTRPGFPDVMVDVWDVGLLIGEWQGGSTLSWRLAAPVPFDFEKSSRGMCEGTVAELPGGRLAMVLRGSNAAWPEKPGYKWMAFSDDDGQTWSKAAPLPFDDGSLIESSATGSTLFRSIRNNKLYWIGNLCLDGERPNGNMPRSPLVICEMQEEPFAFKRSTLCVIDRAVPGEDPRVQHSNFKFYQDRETGDVVLYLTRYGERGYDDNAWIRADLYQYRVQMDD